MATPVNNTYYADFGALEALKKSVRHDDSTAIRKAAQQFESLFTNMLLKSMREATQGVGGDELGDSESTQFYQGMFDQQLAVQLSQGKGLGLADMLVKQLTKSGLVHGAAANPAAKPAVQGAPTIGEGTPAIRRGTQALGGEAATAIPTANAAGPAANSAAANGAAISNPPTSSDAATGDAATSYAVGNALATSDATTDITTDDAIAHAADFVRRIGPAAQAVAERLGVAPEAVIAHAALESGWGQHLPASAGGAQSFNLFGIKAGANWSGASVQAATTEFSGGVATRRNQAFRAYDSTNASMNDYASMLQGSPRYAAALGTGTDVGAFARGLQRGGYATDPNYARKLEAVAASVRSLMKAYSLKTAT